MSLFGYNYLPSTRQGKVSVKRRHSKRPVPDSGGQGNGDIQVERKVARTKEAEKLMPSTPKELVAGQTKGTERLDNFLTRIITVEEVICRMEQKFDKFVCQFEERVKEDGVAVSAQKDVMEQLKQQVGALVTTLRPVVGSLITPAVSVTAGAVEKEVEN